MHVSNSVWQRQQSSALTFGEEGGSLAQLRPLHMVVLLSLNTVEAGVLVGTPARQKEHNTMG